MLTFERFEKLIASPIQQQPVAMRLIGQDGERLAMWLASLSHLDKHEQYRQSKTVLSELIVAPIDDTLRYDILEQSMPTLERLISLMHNDYIHSAQNTSPEQKTCIDEVRSLYFLMILVYQGVALRAYEVLTSDSMVAASSKPTNKNWLLKFTANLSSNVVRNGINIDLVNEPKRLFAVSVFRIMSMYYKLIMEFALTYQKTPNVMWREMNAWYLKAVSQAVDCTLVNKLSNGLPELCIHMQYLQSCAASFANLFAYRRADIINIFKILPTWVQYIHTTFTPEAHLKAFVNLKGDMPPELISPHASINPYSEGNVCLFMDVSSLLDYLNSLQQVTQKLDNRKMFELRLAKIVLLAFDRNAVSASASKIFEYSAQMLTGFNGIYNQIAGGKSFNQIIAQNSLPEIYRAKRIPDSRPQTPKKVQLITRSESGARFFYGDYDEESVNEEWQSCPILQAFGLFALRSDNSTNKHPWRVGIIHWAEPQSDKVVADGRFLGRLLSACGVRLASNDMRSQDFVQALLVAGDGLNQQTTLIIPRYHFKTGDTIILRVDTKQTTLRLEKNLLSTDEFEQYEIVRLI